jgi:hypothetical protein
MAEQEGGTPVPAKKTTASRPAKKAAAKPIPPAAIQKARTEANSAIIDKYRKERDGLIAATLETQGHKGWKPAPTAEEKAAAKLEELYTEFPNLRPAAPVEEPHEEGGATVDGGTP